MSLITRTCALLARTSLVLAIIGLLGEVLCVQTQVVGRYIFNDTPTWAEALAMLLILYVTALGVAVGVRDGGHIGFDSMVQYLTAHWQVRFEPLIHALVALFGALMASSGWLWTRLKWSEIKPMLAVPAGMDFLPLVIAGVLIVIFSLEHCFALLRGDEVQPAWH